jgi:hypothetical protein
MTAGGFAGGRYFATTQVKDSAHKLLKIAIAPEIAMQGWFSTELELNSTARQPAAGSAGAHAQSHRGDLHDSSAKRMRPATKTPI